MMSERGDLISVIDPNAENRRVLCGFLRDAGFATNEAETGIEAVQMAKENPGLMIVAGKLTDGSGADVCRQIKGDAATNHVPIIFVSDETGADSAKRECAADACFTTFLDASAVISMVRVLLRMRDSEVKSHEAQANLSRQLSDMRQLHEVTMRLAVQTDFNQSLREALISAIATAGANRGSISLQAPGIAGVVLAASHGFPDGALRGHEFVSPGASVCGAAYQRRERVIVEDVRTSPYFKDSQDVFENAKFESAHSVPLIARDLRAVGVMTVYFNQTHRPDDREKRLMDLHAQMVADLVERAAIEADRKQQEDAVKTLSGTVESQAKLFDATLSNLTDLAYAFGPDGRFLYANRPLLKILGLRLEQVVGKNCYELNYPKEQADRLQAEIQRVFDFGETINSEIVIKLGDGKEEYHEYNYNPVRDASGKVIAMAGSTRILTERRRAEKRALFLSHLSDQLGLLNDPAEIIKVASREIGEQLGVDRCYFCMWHADMRHVSVADDWHRFELSSLAGVFDLAAFGPPNWVDNLGVGLVAVNDIENDPVWRNYADSYRKIAVRAYAVSRIARQESGVVTLAVASSTAREWAADELTFIENAAVRVWPAVERARAMRALREGEQRYRELVQSLPVAVYTSDAEGRIQLYNEAAVKLWGRAPVIGHTERWCGSQVLFTLDGLQVRLDDSPMAIALRENRALREEMIMQRPTGQLRYVIVNPQPIRDSAGNVVGAVNVVIDITDRKREEQRTTFLHELSQKLSPLTDANEIIRVSSAALGQRLHAHRCYFIECHEGQDHIIVSENWVRDSAPSIVGTYKLSLFGDSAWWQAYSGGNHRVEDVTTHPLTRERAANYEAVGVVSYLVQPFRHQGNWRTLLGVTDNHARAWTDDEMTLVEDVVARVWPMVQRARVMDALRRSENDLRFALDAARLGSWEWDITTGVFRSSERCKANFGLPPEQDFIEGDYTKSILKEDIVRVEQTIDDALTSRTVYETEYRVVWPDGETHWILERGQGVYDEFGKALRVVGVNLDITERKGAEQVLRETAERLQIALDAAHLGIWSWDLNSDRMRISPRMVELMDLPTGEGDIRRTALRDRLHEDDRERARLANEHALANHVDYDEEYRLRLRDGSITWIASKGRGIYDVNGKPTGMLGVIQDITARKHVENYLRQQKEILEQVVRGDSLKDILSKLTVQVEALAERKIVASVLLFDASEQVLRPVAGASVPADWNHYVGYVVPGPLAGSSGAAAYSGRQVIVRDIANSPLWTAHRDEAAKHGFKACWATPIMSSDGKVLGVFSVYYFEITDPTARELQVIDLLTRTASIAIERQRDEKAVRDSEERLRLATATGKVGVWDWDIATNRVTWSDSVYKVHGVAHDEFDGTIEGFSRLIHEADRERLSRALENTLSNGDPFELEFRAVRPDGREVWLFTNANVLRENGLPARLTGATLDITERKRAEEELRKKEQQLSLVTGSAPVLLTQCDREERFTFANRAYLEKRGLSAEQLIGRPIKEIVGEAYPSVKPYIDRVLRGEKISFEVDLPYRGEIRAMEATYIPEFDTDGKVNGWVSAVSDITERKRVHDAVRQLAAIVESSDDAIISRTLGGDIISWNKGAEKLFGYSAAEVLGRPVMILIPEERHGEESVITAKIRQGETVEHYETTRVRKNGEHVQISLSVSPIKDENGRVIGASKISRNITQQKRYEAELENAQAQLRAHAQNLEQKVEERTTLLREAVAQMEEFSYTVSHDLRAPLRAMNSYSQALIEDYSSQLDPTAKEYLNRIQRSCQRMEQLTHDVLMYSRLVRSEVILVDVDLEDMVSDVVDQYEELQAPKAEVEIVAPLGHVLGHEVSLGQCLANLLTNAVKFMAPGVKPKIRVSAEHRGEKIRLWIVDNGIGIAPEHQTRIFLIFERLHGREQYEGTGMGLAIVRKAMEKMGGTCGVESNGRDGSRFWLELPAMEKHP